MKPDRPHQHLYDRKWAKISKAFLKRNPLCAYCLQMGRTTAATLTDHIEPHRGCLKLFYDHNNYQALCSPCHDGPKRLEESRGYSIGCDANGMPVGKHPWNEVD